MVGKGQWVFIPYLVTKELPRLRLSPLRVKEERGRRLWWLEDYSYSNINSETIPIAVMPAMQYGRSLERLIREVVIAYPAPGPVHVLKEDVSASFYCIELQPTDSPKMGIVFPQKERTRS